MFPRTILNKNAIVKSINLLQCRRLPSFSNEKPSPVKLAYKKISGQSSSQSPLIIQHGLFGSKQNWDGIAKAINKKTNRDVVTVDCRNHGESPHTKDHTYDHMVEDIVKLIGDLHIPKACFLGHSMGGRVMMYLALKYPSLVDKLIVADISPVSNSSKLWSMQKFFQYMEEVHFPKGTSLPEVRRNVDQQLSNKIGSKTVRAFLLTNVIQDSGRFRWRFNISALKNNFEKILRFPKVTTSYKGPTLFLAGSKSDYVSLKDLHKIKELFPKARIQYIEGAGHWLHIEKPKDFVIFCTHFLSE